MADNSGVTTVSGKVGYSLAASYGAGQSEGTNGEFSSYGFEAGLFAGAGLENSGFELNLLSGFALGYQRLVATDGSATLNRSILTTPLTGNFLQVPLTGYLEGGHRNDEPVFGGGFQVGLRLDLCKKTWSAQPGIAIQGALQAGGMTDLGWDLGRSGQVMVHVGQTYVEPMDE